MIRIENTQVYDFTAAIRGMRNPLNSWDKSDTREGNYIGVNDMELMQKLTLAGNDHSKFLRMMGVSCDMVAPLYWWKEFDTYKVGVVRNSCSTMHTIHKRPLTLEDFSTDHLFNSSKVALLGVIETINQCRDFYKDTSDKDYWWQIIQLLPSSYNQRATVMLNYMVLRNMYHARKNHKLDCWRYFCKWIETLPYAKELICNVD